MIAVDSSTLIHALKGMDSPQVLAFRSALATDQLALPPPVVTEVISFGDEAATAAVAGYRQLPIVEGFWERAAQSRWRLLRRGLKARLGDALIAQCCIDARMPLITSDRDFRHFAAHCGLTLVVALA